MNTTCSTHRRDESVLLQSLAIGLLFAFAIFSQVKYGIPTPPPAVDAGTPLAEQPF